MFELVYNRIQEMMNHENVGAFIYQTAKYKALNFKRKQETKQNIEQSTIGEGVTGHSPSAYEEMIYQKDVHIDENHYVNNILSEMNAEQLLEYVCQVIEEEGKVYLGVDCEALNPTAFRFWQKHFSSYTYSYIRRLDERIITKAF